MATPSGGPVVEIHFTGVLIASVVAFGAPLLLQLAPRVRVPAIVLEIVGGIAIGPAGLGWVRADDIAVRLLSLIGLGTLLFLAGLEIDVERLRGRRLELAGSAFGVSVGLAVAAGYGLAAVGVHGSPLLLAIIFTSTSLGLLVPVLKDTGQVATGFGQLMMAAGTLGEFGSIVLLTLFFSQQASSPRSRLLLLALFGLFAVGVAGAVGRAWHSRWLSSALLRLDDTTAQLRVRATVVLLAAFAVLADDLGFEAILGTFVAGAILQLVDTDQRATSSRFRMKLDAIGYGFVVPFFFVYSGIQFDLHALLHPAALAKVPLFAGVLLLVRGLPAALYRPAFGTRSAVVAGLLQATSLTFVVVAAHLGQELGKLSRATSAALIAAGLLSVMVFPAVALVVAQGRARPASAPEAGRRASRHRRPRRTSTRSRPLPPPL